MLGDIFKTHGLRLKTLMEAPVAANLKDADIYLIVDPDTDKETSKPNAVQSADADAIATWVKKAVYWC